MAAESSSVKTTLFELAFILTAENVTLGVLNCVGSMVFYLQMIALIMDLQIPWGLNSFQRGLQYLIMPWTFSEESFLAVVSVVLAASICFGVLHYQAHFKGGVTSVWLLNIGRLAICLLATAFYLPFLKTLLTPYGVALQDWSSGLKPTMIPYQLTLAAISLVVIIPLVVTFRLLYIIPDPLDKFDLMTCATTRLEVLEILSSTIIVVVNVLFKDPLILAIVFWTLTFIRLAALVFYPYCFRAMMNYYKAGCLGSLFYLAVNALYVAQNPQTMVQGATRFGLFPLGALFFVCLVYLRLHSRTVLNYCNKVEGERELIKKCSYPLDLELATRPCLHSNASQELVEFGGRLYQLGLTKFPSSVYLHTRYIVFMIFVLKRKIEQLEENSGEPSAANMDIAKLKLVKQVQLVIKKTLRMEPRLDHQFFFFYIATLLEQNALAEEAGETNMSLLRAIQFKRDLGAAKLNLMDTNDYMRYFWKEASQDTIDVDRLSYLSDMVHYHSKTSETYFKRTLSEFPNCNIALVLYTDLLRLTFNDDKQAKIVEENVKRARDALEQARLMQAGISKDNEESSSAINLYSAIAANISHESSKKNPILRKLHVSTKILAIAMCVVIIMSSMGYCGLYIYTKVILRNLNIVSISEFGTIRTLGQKIAFVARQLEMQQVFGLGSSSNEDIKNNLVQLSSSMRELITSVKYTKLKVMPDAEVDWNDDDIDLTIRTSDGSPHSSYTSLDRLWSAYTAFGTILGSQNLSSFTVIPPKTLSLNVSTPFLGHPQWSFIVDNGHKNLFEHSWHLTRDITHHFQSILAGNKQVFLVILGVVLALPVLASIIAVVPLFSKVKRERHKVLEMFTLLDREVLIEMMAKAKAEDIKLKIKGVKTSHSNSIHSHADSSDHSEKDFTDFESLGSLGSSVSTLAPWWRLAVFYLIALLILLAILLTTTLFAYSACDLAYTYSVELNYAESRSSTVKRLAGLSQEIIRRDSVIWPDMADLQNLVLEELKFAQTVHHGLSFGNDSLALSGINGRISSLDDLMFKRRCSSSSVNCLGLDEMYNGFLNQAHLLTQVAVNALAYDLPVYKKIMAMDGALSNLTNTAVELIQNEAGPRFVALDRLSDILLGVAIPLAIIGILAISWAANQLIESINGSRRIMSALPANSISRNVPILTYVKHGLIDDKAYQEQVIRVTKDRTHLASSMLIFPDGKTPKRRPSARDDAADPEIAIAATPSLKRRESLAVPNRF